ncbi:hypothetical protein CBR_g25856 [Chara braunii]|uniref:Squalene synthase n=1 Tax=Chara braunii TaxID=69332 RepID=A0A388L6J1_CHABU|nr:hypothetical protein CBR_g25856 [Chara braunii]|eukprot:GBG77925.1 hypothetical protein CBR_g25856 [Chara braunii]
MEKMWLLLQRPDEMACMWRVRMASRRITKLPKDPDLAFCYAMLNRVSRSFAIVIQQLGQELRDAVCIFYLVLRGLDTVEDDMSIPVERKIPTLLDFHKTMYDTEWKFPCGDKDYQELMDKFHHVTASFLRLHRRYQEVIADVTRRMGEGMAKFITTDVDSVQRWDEYCHYVAGLVGIGLSELFVAAGLESSVRQEQANSMGLFLQKTNIIRDYLEDICEQPAPRMFWPKEVWSCYAEQLEDFKDDKHIDSAVKCLNHLVTDALRHAPDCLEYLAGLKARAVFRFCAIPQVMAMGTLMLCYGEPQVFKGVVKMRRGMAAKIMDKTLGMADVYGSFYDFATWMTSKVDTERDPNAHVTLKRLKDIQDICMQSSAFQARQRSLMLQMKAESSATWAVWFLFILYAVFAFGLLGTQETMGIPVAFEEGTSSTELYHKALASLLLVGSTLVVLQSFIDSKS